MHPYQYDIDKVDLRYMINSRLVDLVVRTLPDKDAVVFWLSYFKTKAAVSADDFFMAIKEIALMNGA